MLEQFAYFVGRAPASLRFVLIGRVAPSLPWGRWAVRGGLTEVPESMLVMDAAEAAQLVRRAASGVPADTAVEAVVAAASGWPAALRLGGVALGAIADTDRHAAPALARDRLFFDFVAGEVLAALPAGLFTPPVDLRRGARRSSPPQRRPPSAATTSWSQP